jgi:hypothetical protein
MAAVVSDHATDLYLSLSDLLGGICDARGGFQNGSIFTCDFRISDLALDILDFTSGSTSL